MAAAFQETLVNQARTFLDGNINAVVTSINVTDGSVFPNAPADGVFRIRIDDEIMLVTNRSTNALTVVRGQDGTSALSHTSGADARHIVSGDGFNRYLIEAVPQFQVKYPLHSLTDINGNTLTVSSFTALNVDGSTTINDDNGTIIIKAAQLVNEYQIWHKAAPSTPYVVTMCMMPWFRANAQVVPSMVFRQSGAPNPGRLKFFANWKDVQNPEIGIFNYTTPSGFFSTQQTTHAPIYNPLWMRQEDDGTDLTWQISSDGFEFFEVATIGRTNFFGGGGGPDQIGFAYNNDSSVTQLMTILHWSEE